jgi:NAD(P) transhydrogenase
MDSYHYDLIVIGSGPAGQKAAIAAAKSLRRVAIVDRRFRIGGSCVHSGTIPSKMLREAILRLSAFRDRNLFGRNMPPRNGISIQDLNSQVDAIVSRESAVILDQLQRNNVTVYDGSAEFVDPHAIRICQEEHAFVIRGDFILIACGSRPAREAHIPFDGAHVIDTEQLLQIKAVPREAIIVGAGVVGLEYSSLLGTLGCEVTLVDERSSILEFVDREIVEALMYHLRRLGTILRLGERAAHIEVDDWRDRVVAELESGKKLQATLLVYSAGRSGNADRLIPEAAGLHPDGRGRLKVNESFQTEVPHIYAAGDVIGFPALASTSMEQGRLASCHMFKMPCEHIPELFPYGIYTIPEISMVGQTEEELTRKKVPYEVGIAKYSELAKSMMLGDGNGMLKLLFDRKTTRLLGVHAIGDRAAEIIHIGQAILAHNGSIEYFRDTVFNYPTLAEAYKVAALDGLNKLV